MRRPRHELTALKCAAMNAVWLGAMSYLALEGRTGVGPRTFVGIAVAWLLATLVTWRLFRGATGLRVWQLAVWTFLLCIVVLVVVTVGAAFVYPGRPGPG